MYFYVETTLRKHKDSITGNLLLRGRENVKHFKDFKNLTICINDEKGTPGKPYHEPATSIPRKKKTF